MEGGLERTRERGRKSRENNAISGEALFNLLQVDGGSPIASSGLISNPHELSVSAHLPLELWNGPRIACLGRTWRKAHALAFCFPSFPLFSMSARRTPSPLQSKGLNGDGRNKTTPSHRNKLHGRDSILRCDLGEMKLIIHSLQFALDLLAQTDSVTSFDWSLS